MRVVEKIRMVLPPSSFSSEAVQSFDISCYGKRAFSFHRFSSPRRRICRCQAQLAQLEMDNCDPFALRLPDEEPQNEESNHEQEIFG
jgi:hypothetical protein